MDAKERFSDRVEHYVKYRPGYPPEVLQFLQETIGLAPWWTVADVGSGTGILARLFLEFGNRVYGVEPNRAMRKAAERLLANHRRFHSINGSAEATTLKTHTINLVVAGQAFHWFNPAEARAEFVRILTPGSCVALLWNDRKTNATPFLAAYDKLLRMEGLDYVAVNHRKIDGAALRAFFGRDRYREMVCPNAQDFDWDGLYGRAMSSSYVPGEGHPRHERFTALLREVYDRYAVDGRVTFEYDTRLYYGPLT